MTRATAGSLALGTGSVGSEVSAADMSSVDERSPVADRRHAERFGTSTPKRVSRNRSIEVWSNRSEFTHPPRLNGETTSMGTRNPSPIGRVIPWASEGSGDTVNSSPAVPGGGTGGATWSKNPPFSS